MPAALPCILLAAAAWQAPAAGVKAMTDQAPNTRPAPGTPAPAFSAPASGGRTVRLADFAGKQSVVLAFFPKAFTPGWTKEMAAFRDRYAEFTAAGAQVLGASIDPPEVMSRFAESLQLPFPLLADADGAVARAYGVAKDGVAQRVTFVIGKDGLVKQVFEGKEALDPAGALGACGG